VGSIPDVRAFCCGKSGGGGVASVMFRGGSAGGGSTAGGGGGSSSVGGGGAPTNGVAPAGRGSSATGGGGGGGRSTPANVGAPPRAGPAAGAYWAIFLSETAGDEPFLVPFIPSVALGLRCFGSGGASSGAPTVLSQAVVRAAEDGNRPLGSPPPAEATCACQTRPAPFFRRRATQRKSARSGRLL